MVKKGTAKKGWDLLYKKYDKKVVDSLIKLQKFSPAFVEDVIIEFAFGNLWQRPLFNAKEKEKIVLASLITQGCVEDQFRGHVQTALNVGVTVEEIKEILILLTTYIGVPRCLKALLIVQAVVEGK